MSISLIFDTQEELNSFLQNKKEDNSYSGLLKLNIKYDKCQDKITELSEENERLNKELAQKKAELLQNDKSYKYLSDNYTKIFNERENLREMLKEELSKRIDNHISMNDVELKYNEEEGIYDFIDYRSDLPYKED